MHSPTPWRVVHGPARGLVILDAGGEAVNERDRLREELDVTREELRIAVHRDEQAGKACRKWGEKYRAIFEERERLRDLVRRLANSLDYALDQAGGEWQSDLDSGSEPDFSKERALIREAREALGGGPNGQA